MSTTDLTELEPEQKAVRKPRPRWQTMLLALIAAIVALIALVAVIGMATPPEHTATAALTLAQPQAVIWADVTEWERYPEWRSPLKRVEAREDPNGHERWLEDWGPGQPPVELEVTESIPMSRRVVKIHDSSGVFGGHWTFELTPADTGTTLRITEEGEIYSPMIRGVMRLMPSQGTDYYLRLWLTQLGARYGITPEWDPPAPTT